EAGSVELSPPVKEGQRRRHGVAEGWWQSPKTTPPRRCAPPRLVRGGECRTLPSCEGGAEATPRRRRGVVAEPQNHTTPALRATPPRERRGVSNAPLPWRRGTTRPDRAANGWLRELSRQRIHQLGDAPELFQVLQRRDRALEP